MAKKGKRKKERRKKLATGGGGAPLTRSPDEMERLRDLWEQGKEARAIEEGERLLRTSPQDPQVHAILGQFYASLGRQTEAFEHLETAARLLPSSPELDFLRAIVYERMRIHSHALRAARRYLSSASSGEEAEEIKEILRFTENLVAEWAARFDISAKRMEQGSFLMEEGRLALHSNDFAYALRCSKEASSLMPKWAVPRNNAALALFYLGKVKEAITIEEQAVTELDPDNIHALSNLVRFHVVLDHMEQAQAYGNRLEKLTPVYYDDHLKMVEAFTLLGRDRAVGDVLNMVKPSTAEAEIDREWFLGVAAANMGKMKEARSHLRRANVDSDAFRSKVASLILAGLPALGGRYPYNTAAQHLPQNAAERAFRQLDEQRVGAEQSLRDLVKKYPALIDIAAECLWLLDDEAAKSAINALRAIGSEKAIELLRTFSTGQAGSDEARTYAALALANLKATSPDEPMVMFKDGRPTPVLLREITIVTSREPVYSPDINQMLEEAIIAQREGRGGKAEQLYERILAKNPNVKEALSNLGVLYFLRGDTQLGEEYYRKAIKVDPLYVSARANLASIRLSQNRIEEAKETLRPLAELREFHIEEIIRYASLMARVALAEQDFEVAKNHLSLVLELDPNDEWARETMDRLGVAGHIMGAAGTLGDWLRKRVEQYKERKQKLPISPNDPLLPLLSRYSKDALTGVAREIFLRSSSGLKKDALISAIREVLLDAESLQRVFRTLSDEDLAALRFMLQAGGVVPLMEFVEKYGDDADESPYWNFHVPETTLGRLKVRGLLFEGTHDGRVVLVVPEELRPLCQSLATRRERTASDE